MTTSHGICPKCRGPLELVSMDHEKEIQGEYHEYMGTVTEHVFVCFACLDWYGQNAKPRSEAPRDR